LLIIIQDRLNSRPPASTFRQSANFQGQPILGSHQSRFPPRKAPHDGQTVLHPCGFPRPRPPCGCGHFFPRPPPYFVRPWSGFVLITTARGWDRSSLYELGATSQTGAFASPSSLGGGASALADRPWLLRARCFHFTWGNPDSGMCATLCSLPTTISSPAFSFSNHLVIPMSSHADFTV